MDKVGLPREADDGSIENIYNLKVMNTTEAPKRYLVSVEGLAGIEIAGERVVEVDSAQNHEVTIVVRVPLSQATGAQIPYTSISRPKGMTILRSARKPLSFFPER